MTDDTVVQVLAYNVQPKHHSWHKMARERKEMVRNLDDNWNIKLFQEQFE